ncbi:MAG: radical SAM protein [Euryarchaeota archaeon]|nr:radical SAM protein [Euryarchaeota archaeon]
MKHTKSLCPVCQAVITAVVFEEDGKVMMEKTCDDHGTFKEVYWSDVQMYNKFDGFAHDGTGFSNPMTLERSGCPFDCGICPSHKTSTLLANIDVTNRCNLNCPVCFANAKKSGYILEPDIEKIRDMMLMLRNERPTPCYAIQLTGGEPTVRDDLPQIVRMAREMGFVHVQVATNGVRLSKSIEYCRELSRAGLHTVYLSFDGVTEEPYHKTYNFNALPIKKRAIENCRQAGLRSVVLVPTLAKGVNDHQVGDIVRFAADKLDVVKGINFQPISFAGRIDQKKRETSRVTIPDLMKLMEEQTNGEIPTDAWYPVSFVVPISRFVERIHKKNLPEFTVHPHCGTGTYVYIENDRIIPITEFIDVEGFMEFIEEATSQLDVNSRNLKVIANVVHKLPSFVDTQKGPKSVNVTKLLINLLKNGTEEVTKEFHRNTLFLGAMHFQDLYNIDLERVQRCGIHYATPDGRVIPFCTYNTLYRADIEAKYSRPYKEEIPVSNSYDCQDK